MSRWNLHKNDGDSTTRRVATGLEGQASLGDKSAICIMLRTKRRVDKEYGSGAHEFNTLANCGGKWTPLCFGIMAITRDATPQRVYSRSAPDYGPGTDRTPPKPPHNPGVSFRDFHRIIRIVCAKGDADSLRRFVKRFIESVRSRCGAGVASPSLAPRDNINWT